MRRDQSRAYYKQQKKTLIILTPPSLLLENAERAFERRLVCLFVLWFSNKKPEDSSEEATRTREHARALAAVKSRCQNFYRVWECDVVLTSSGLVPELRCVAKCVNLWNATVCECERFERVTELTAASGCVCVCVGVASFVAVCFCCCCCCWLILFCICIYFCSLL